MPRLPLTHHHHPAVISRPTPEDAAIVERIKQRRGSGGLLELDQMLLHSPPVADGWNTLLGAIRTQTTIADDFREVIICRVAALNRAQYEWDQHEPLLREALHKRLMGYELRHYDDPAAAEAAIRTFIEALRRPAADDLKNLAMNLNWTTTYSKLIDYVDAMTRHVKVQDETYKALRGYFRRGQDGDRWMVEVTAVCAAYNCVSRFLVALHVGDVEWKD